MSGLQVYLKDSRRLILSFVFPGLLPSTPLTPGLTWTPILSHVHTHSSHLKPLHISYPIHTSIINTMPGFDVVDSSKTSRFFQDSHKHTIG